MFPTLLGFPLTYCDFDAVPEDRVPFLDVSLFCSCEYADVEASAIGEEKSYSPLSSQIAYHDFDKMKSYFIFFADRVP